MCTDKTIELLNEHADTRPTLREIQDSYIENYEWNEYKQSALRDCIH